MKAFKELFVSINLVKQNKGDRCLLALRITLLVKDGRLYYQINGVRRLHDKLFHNIRSYIILFIISIVVFIVDIVDGWLLSVCWFLPDIEDIKVAIQCKMKAAIVNVLYICKCNKCCNLEYTMCSQYFILVNSYWWLKMFYIFIRYSYKQTYQTYLIVYAYKFFFRFHIKCK